METLDNHDKRCLTCLVGVLPSAHSVFDVDVELGVTLSAALWDLTRIEVKDNGQLPIHLCADCRRNLRDAVGFTRQAREANQHWLSIADCLQETTIDVKEVKNEIEAVSIIPTLNEANSVPESTDPIAVGRFEGEDLRNDQEAPNGATPSSPKRRRGRPSNLNVDEDLSECSEAARFSCNVCGKSFAWKKDVQRHAKSHFPSPSFECEACGRQFLRKDKLKDHQKIHRSLMDGEEAGGGGAAAISSDNSPEKPARKCATCDKVFVWPKDLTRHQRLHQSGDERHQCPFCERQFSRKDNLHTHIKTHGAKAYSEVCKRELRPSPKEGPNGVGEHLCKPHGCKVIQCMVCSSKHTRIADLRAHLLTHQAEEAISTADDSEAARIGGLLYPDEEGPMSAADLAARIRSDVAANRMHHLYSISDELGYELSLDSSETESESDSECGGSRPAEPKYSCDLCGAGEQRKYQMFAHQLQRHAWLEAKHVCGECQRRFVSLPLLQHHRRQQCGSDAKRFHCRKCDTRFMWRDNLQIHLRSCHADPKQSGGPPEQPESFDCGDCGRSFRMQKDLTRHMVMHRSDSPVFRCLWCPRRFYRLENLHRHVRRHDVAADQLKAAECIMRATSQPHGRKEIQCRVCNVPFDTLASLKAHMLQESASALSPHHQHSHPYSIVDAQGYEMDLNDSASEDEQAVPRQYTCVLCNLVCQRKYEIVQHQRSIHKHELLPFRCQHCVYRTVCQELLAHHLAMHCLNTSKQYACDECPFKFAWQENLAEHKKREHSSGKEAEEEETKETGETNSTAKESPLQKSDTKTFKCVHCPRKYNRKDRLSAHIKKFHDPERVVHSPAPRRNAPANARDMQKAAAAKQKYLCAFCGRAVTSSSNLIIHMRRHTGEKPFKCDFCEMAFPRSSDLQCHRRTHTGEKPHQCTVCQKSFSRSYKLQTHMRIHNGERPYKCTYCEKSFTQSNDLTLHIRRHTGERPYVCDLCGERFIQGTALKYHRIMMHGQSEETAQNCKS